MNNKNCALNFKVALNLLRRIFCNFEKGFIVSCLSQIDNKK